MKIQKKSIIISIAIILLLLTSGIVYYLFKINLEMKMKEAHSGLDSVRKILGDTPKNDS